METNEISHEFCQLLGKIFYGAAMADRVIKEEEIERFVSLVDDEWGQYAESITQSFYQCINAAYDGGSIFSEIEAHKLVDPTQFNAGMNERVMATAYAIVASYSATNKSEIVFISRLRNLLYA